MLEELEELNYNQRDVEMWGEGGARRRPKRKEAKKVKMKGARKMKMDIEENKKNEEEEERKRYKTL